MRPVWREDSSAQRSGVVAWPRGARCRDKWAALDLDQLIGFNAGTQLSSGLCWGQGYGEVWRAYFLILLTLLQAWQFLFTYIFLIICTEVCKRTVEGSQVSRIRREAHAIQPLHTHSRHTSYFSRREIARIAHQFAPLLNSGTGRNQMGFPYVGWPDVRTNGRPIIFGGVWLDSGAGWGCPLSYQCAQVRPAISTHTGGRFPKWQRSTLVSMKQFCNKLQIFNTATSVLYLEEPEEVPQVENGIDVCYTGPPWRSPWAWAVMAGLTFAHWLRVQQVCSLTQLQSTIRLERWGCWHQPSTTHTPTGVITFMTITTALEVWWSITNQKSYDTF